MHQVLAHAKQALTPHYVHAFRCFSLLQSHQVTSCHMQLSYELSCQLSLTTSSGGSKPAQGNTPGVSSSAAPSQHAAGGGQQCLTQRLVLIDSQYFTNLPLADGSAPACTALPGGPVPAAPFAGCAPALQLWRQQLQLHPH
jgi:hypothetical protein